VGESVIAASTVKGWQNEKVRIETAIKGLAREARRNRGTALFKCWRPLERVIFEKRRGNVVGLHKY
jgi:hypothetical protein